MEEGEIGQDLHGNTSETVANAGQSTEVIQNSELVELAQNVDDEVVAPNIPRAGIELHDEPGDPTVENLKEQVLVADVAVAEAAEGTSDVTAATTEEMLTTDQEGSVNGTFPIDPGPDLHDSSQTTEEMDRENPFFLVKNRKTISRGWKFSGNYEENDSGRIVIVWDPKVPMLIYNTTAQSVTCGESLVDMHLSSPVATHPCLQDAQLFEAQAKKVFLSLGGICRMIIPSPQRLIMLSLTKLGPLLSRTLMQNFWILLNRIMLLVFFGCHLSDGGL
ncbi:unnamed protein product [Brassica napus]|uniref:(rape) hypothetical protein n=1 Tax=Brassica napus TaxID=3708 RepID=A0A816J0P9_BRANA|nr:unnamed protein product [Brassica napus]